MFDAFALSLKSLTYPKVQAILFKSILLTLLIFALLGTAVWWGIDWLIGAWIMGGDGWIATTAAIGSFIVTLLSMWLLFRIIAMTVIWFFSDEIVDAIEKRDYPLAAASGKTIGYGASIILALRSLLRVIGYNLVALPLYLLLLFTAIGAPIVFVIVNALLLGRDLEEMLGARHGRGSKHMKKTDRLLLGLGGTAGMMVPFVNLAIPVIATATAVHLMHGKVNNRG